ncbi:MAG: patatin-like phospholipase family protein [Proteobacteria bacterium]|jgi:NTE family protein|nr:patatin-like phospholipase family protein [Pseudomonadota bacterium]
MALLPNRILRTAQAVAAIAVLVPSWSFAATAPCAVLARGDGQSRPSIGLVLSGGGARGYAHLGVLRVLEEHRIPVDCIAATSMGAVIGGLYASGDGVDALIAKLSTIDLSNIAYDRSDRARLTQSLRDDEYDYPVGITAGFGEGKLRLPQGIVQGNRFLALLHGLTAQIPGSISFDRLPVPFRAIATDLGTGDEVVLARGSLPRAIRASMAAPGLFAPIEIDGHTLVDGALVANLPVQAVRDLGADVVIAVDIGSPLRRAADISSPLDVSQQMLGILIGKNEIEQRKLLRPDDVLITPKLGDITFSDFSQAARAIAAGEAAARAALPALERYALTPAAYRAFRTAQLARVSNEPRRIDRIEIATGGRLPAAYVRSRLGVKEGDIYDPAKLDAAIQAIATSGYFGDVSYNLADVDGKETLKVHAALAAWGPQILLFGLSLDSDFRGEGNYRFSIGHRDPWINASGLEWRNDLVVGSDITDLRTELRQPLGAQDGVYLAPYAGFKQQNHNIFISDLFENQPPNPDPFATYRLTTTQAGVDLGVPLARLGELRIGATWASFVDRPKTYIPADFLAGGVGTANFLPTSRTRLFGPRARLVIDQLDDVLYPRHGYYLRFENETSVLGGGNRYSQSFAKGLWAATSGRHSVNVALEAGGDFGVGNQAQPPGFYLGGFQHLSAYAPDEFAGSYLLYGRVTYLTPLKLFDAPPLHALFAGLSAEAGNVWLRENQFGHGPWKQSYSAFAGLTTGIGPIYLGIASAPQGVVNVYFQLGRQY